MLKVMIANVCSDAVYVSSSSGMKNVGIVSLNIAASNAWKSLDVFKPSAGNTWLV